jgi:hypothetical protein
MTISGTMINRILSAIPSDATEENVLLALTWEIALPLKAMRDLIVSNIAFSNKAPALRLSQGEVPISVRLAKILRGHVTARHLGTDSSIFPPQTSASAFERRLQRICNKVGARVGMPELSLQTIRHARLLELAKIMRLEDFAYLTGLSYQAAARWYQEVHRPDLKRIAKIIRR